VAQSIGPEFKPQYCKKRKKQKTLLAGHGIIPAHGRKEEEDREFKTSLGYKVKSCFKRKKKKKKSLAEWLRW
jgi:hypothetical protein